MLNIKNIKNKKYILIYFLILIFAPSIGLADVVKKFNISGNDRISDETIVLFSGYRRHSVPKSTTERERVVIAGNIYLSGVSKF